MDPDGHLSEQEEQELWRHYGLDDGTGAGSDDRGDTVDRDTSSGPATTP
jgi:hypothetical protein